jgi:hypothetical protein
MIRGSSSTISTTGLRPSITPRRSRSPREQRQLDPERRAAPERALDAHRAAVPAHDVERGREPEPGARTDLLRGEERIEDAVDVVGGDPGARVA